MKRAYEVVLSVAFIALCCIPGLVMLKNPENPNLWNVRPVAYPKFEPDFAWASAFEKYFVANFGLKRRLVQLHNAIGYRVLGDLQSDSVLVGKERWLYLSQDTGWASFRSEERLTPAEARGWARSLTSARRFLERRKTPLLTIIPPSKESIYPEYLPLSATRADSFTRLDQVLTIYDQVGAKYIDLRAPFRAVKDRGRLYDRFDSHWNGRGAELGARLLMREVATALDRPPSYAELDAELVPSKSYVDLAFILALDDYVHEETVSIMPKRPRARRLEPPPSVREPTRRDMNRMVYEVDDESLPTALILRDSFSEGLIPVLSEKFRRSVWIWTHDLDLRLVERERPDIVIVELTERFFANPPPKFLIGRARPRRR